MHKPTLLKVLRMFKDFDPENPDLNSQILRHILERSTTLDPSLDPQKLLAGAGIKL